MQTAAPERSLAQKMDALRRANGVRSRRARFKAQIKRKSSAEAGQQAKEVLTEVPDWAETLKALDLLLAIPKVGRVKANRILNTCRISPSKTVGGLSERQREELLVKVGQL